MRNTFSFTVCVKEKTAINKMHMRVSEKSHLVRTGDSSNNLEKEVPRPYAKDTVAQKEQIELSLNILKALFSLNIIIIYSIYK